MADAETEAEWEKSKRIEAEKMKATQAMNEQAPDRASLAFLEPTEIHEKDWPNGKMHGILNSEKSGNRAFLLAVAGVVLNILGDFGSMNSGGTEYAPSLALLFGGLSSIGYICFVGAFFGGITAIGCELTYKFRDKVNFTTTMWTGLSAFAIMVAYFVIKLFVLNH